MVSSMRGNFPNASGETQKYSAYDHFQPRAEAARAHPRFASPRARKSGAFGPRRAAFARRLRRRSAGFSSVYG
jgi:hypothetical protein